MDNELKDWKKHVLQEYLHDYYVSPIKDPAKKKILADLFVKKEDFYALCVSSRNELKQVVQYYLLSFKGRVYWKDFNSYELVQSFIDSNSPLELTSIYDVVVIYHGFNEMENKRLGDIVNQVVEFRRHKGLKTLFISTKIETKFDFVIENLWSKGRDVLQDEV